MPLSPSPPTSLHTKCNINPLLISCDLIYARPVTFEAINQWRFFHKCVHRINALNVSVCLPELRDPSCKQKVLAHTKINQLKYKNIIPSNNLFRLLFVRKLPRIIPRAILFHAPQDISVVTQKSEHPKTDRQDMSSTFFL